MSGKKVISIVVSVIAIISVGAGVATFVLGNRVREARDPNIQTSDAKSKYLVSSEFENLSKDQKIKYVKAVNPREVFKNYKNLSDEEKKNCATRFVLSLGR